MIALTASPEARAQAATCTSVPCSEVHTVGLTTQAAPLEQSFSISAPGTYQITLTDLGAQLTPSAPLQSVQLSVSTGTSLVGTPLMAAGTASFTAAAAGTYVLHIVGTPGTGLGSGLIGVQVIAANLTVVDSFSGALTAPSQALPATEALLNDSATITSAGAYTVALSDLNLQQALGTVALLLVPPGGNPVATLSGTSSAPVTLAAGTYDVLAVGQAGAGATSGLFNVQITSSAGAVAYSKTVTVGGATLLGSPVLAAGSYTLTGTDLKFPGALSQLGVVVVLDGHSVTGLTGASSTSLSVTAGGATYQVYGAAVPVSAGTNAGSYSVQLAPQGGGAAVLDETKPVVAQGSTLTALSYDATVSSAGQYTATFTDFGFPSQLSGINWEVAQAGQVLGKSSNATAVSLNAAAGGLSALVFVQPGTSGGLFNLNVGAGGMATPIVDATQGVGQLVSQRQIAITTPGSYAITAVDLGFPANLQNFYIAVTHETQAVGTIFGAGTFSFSASAGNYFLNFIAQPATAASYGTYAFSVAPASAPPTVNLSADATSVASGGTVHLVWSSQGATSCTASGGWSGTEAITGTATSPAITSNTTFTLSCTGPGGTTSQSVMISISAAKSGGGGSLDLYFLAVLAGLLAAQSMRGRQDLGPKI